MMRTTGARLALPLLFLLALAAASFAEEPEPRFLRHLFPPELVMQHSGEIHLSDEQRKAITEEIHAVQGQVLELQWEMQADATRLEELAAAETIDEEALVARAHRIFEHEGEVKATHLRLLVRIRNALTPEQRARLQALRP